MTWTPPERTADAAAIHAAAEADRRPTPELYSLDPDDVLTGIRAVSRGESPIHPKAARALLGARSAGGRPQLTAREVEVLTLVRDGLANKQIAKRLEISERTVKAHLTSAFSRIGVSDRTQAALWAQRNGL